MLTLLRKYNRNQTLISSFVVTQSAEADIPVLAVTPPVVNATTGASVTLVCNLMHDGEYAIDAPTWTKDGEMVESDRRVEVDGKSLVLMAVTPADSGVYGCGQQINLVKGMLSPYNVTSATSELTGKHPTNIGLSLLSLGQRSRTALHAASLQFVFPVFCFFLGNF